MAEIRIKAGKLSAAIGMLVKLVHLRGEITGKVLQVLQETSGALVELQEGGEGKSVFVDLAYCIEIRFLGGTVKK